ncbi:hypothetical protein [Streptomyces sp. NPDC058855]|uniref:hypothetical protein n=1 Tax=Streptomyces sp. NPDC058855 TaxID=3346651 RepID=UPI0036C09AAD
MRACLLVRNREAVADRSAHRYDVLALREPAAPVEDCVVERVAGVTREATTAPAAAPAAT